MSENREPSMEEIVASIRRIIAQGGGPASSSAATEGQPSEDDAGSEASATPEAASDDLMEEAHAMGDVSGLDSTAEPVEPAFPFHSEQDAQLEPDMTEASDQSSDTEPFSSSDETETYSGAEAAPAEAEASGSDTLSAARLQSQGAEESPLITGSAADSTRAAFGQLSQSFAGQQDGRTVEKIVEDLLRPQLKAWLDENLASIVHARVQAEVERIARTRGR